MSINFAPSRDFYVKLFCIDFFFCYCKMNDKEKKVFQNIIGLVFSVLLLNKCIESNKSCVQILQASSTSLSCKLFMLLRFFFSSTKKRENVLSFIWDEKIALFCEIVDKVVRLDWFFILEI